MLKVEIDVLKRSDLDIATRFMIKHKCPTLVVAPELVQTATINRALGRGEYKIFTAVDWPKGNQFLSDKFRGMPSESVNVDGFEILLTAGRQTAISKEIKFLADFFRDYFPPTTELRFVLGWFAPGRNQEQFEHMLEACNKVVGPALIRTTHLTKLTSVDGSTDSHKAVVETISGIKRIPIKISGNIGMQTRLGCKNAVKYACTLRQAMDLSKELSNGVLEDMTDAVNSEV